jgi:hypothetical protein
MLETHIVMSSLIFHLVLTLVLRLAHLLVLCLISLMDLTITSYPSSKRVELKPLYVCPGCSNHTYSNNMIIK